MGDLENYVDQKDSGNTQAGTESDDEHAQLFALSLVGALKGGLI